MSETKKRTQSEQARINGAKSHGPTSPEGKAKSSSNALKHGFAATINTVISIEDKPAFDLHLQGIRASFNPQNYMEETLVDQLASISWRQVRLVATETALLDAQMGLHDKNVCDLYPRHADDNYFHLVQAWQALARPPHKDIPTGEERNILLAPKGYDINSLELLRRYQTSLDRQFRNTLLNLQQYRKSFAPVSATPQQDTLARPEEPKDPAPPKEESARTDTPKAKMIVFQQPSPPQNVTQTESNAPVSPVTPINKR